MNFTDLEASALTLNDLYERLETKLYGRVWSTQELALGFMGDVGDLAKLVQAAEGVRAIPDARAKLGHELADCLWSVMTLARLYEIDLEASFLATMDELEDGIAQRLTDARAPR